MDKKYFYVKEKNSTIPKTMLFLDIPLRQIKFYFGKLKELYIR